jgi:NAD-dependent SIR2 family protein deacetylase
VGHHGEVTRDVGTAELARLVSRGAVAVLTGAGISTESGIPDYRGATGSAQRRHAPMTFQAFRDDPVARRRYWARSHVGWGFMASAAANTGHQVVARLESRGLVDGVVTQNVDGLHQAAGSRAVIDLHGRLDRVVCLACGTSYPRSEVRDRLTEANAAWRANVTGVNPDGDVDIPDEQLDGFVVVDCPHCGGVLKPDVVYFGESVPPARVHASYALVEASSLLLVLGTSLTVFSGRRFVVRAAAQGIPVAIVNEGPTRGDEHAALKLETPLGATLDELESLIPAVA